MLLHYLSCIIYLWQMLLPKDYVYPLFTVGRCYCFIFVVYVKTTFGRCYLPSGRWNSHMLQQMAGVICQVADGIATIGWGCVVNSMLTGRWNSHV